MNSQLRKIFFLFIFTIFIAQCTRDQIVAPVPDPVPHISNLMAPLVVFNASLTKHTISVQVQDAQGVQDIAEVHYEIRKKQTNDLALSGLLIDDGTHGDIIPKDGVFTNQIDGSFARGDTGQFELRVFARDKSDHASDTLSTTILVVAGVENAPPVITKTAVPALVPIDSLFDFVIAVQVQDEDGLQDIKKVSFQFFPPEHPNPTLEGTLVDDGTSGDEMPGDGIYSNILSSNLIKEPTDYFLRFEAEDQAGNKSDAKVVTIRGRPGLNDPPVISNVVAPDTVKIDPQQNTRILITVDVTDPQGLDDIDYVQFRSFLPDGREAQDSPIQMADDGNTSVTGDEVAGDGTYSRIIILPSSGVMPGDFRFVFQASDKSGALSNTIEHILTVIE